MPQRDPSDLNRTFSYFRTPSEVAWDISFRFGPSFPPPPATVCLREDGQLFFSKFHPLPGQRSPALGCDHPTGLPGHFPSLGFTQPLKFRLQSSTAPAITGLGARTLFHLVLHRLSGRHPDSEAAVILPGDLAVISGFFT